MYYNFTSNIMGKGSFSEEMEMGQLKNKIENKK
ncbi:aspartyl-phosphate phosphatase Spo0E family protein, partial [Bacillus anthracis]|nr:aspartyl-phosphate phosphatase Spo0E family protein [Bacillus anthracis]